MQEDDGLGRLGDDGLEDHRTGRSGRPSHFWKTVPLLEAVPLWTGRPLGNRAFRLLLNCLMAYRNMDPFGTWLLAARERQDFLVRCAAASASVAK